MATRLHRRSGTRPRAPFRGGPDRPTARLTPPPGPRALKPARAGGPAVSAYSFTGDSGASRYAMMWRIFCLVSTPLAPNRGILVQGKKAWGLYRTS